MATNWLKKNWQMTYKLTTNEPDTDWQMTIHKLIDYKWLQADWPQGDLTELTSYYYYYST